jgi:hypothetical protein
MIGGFSSSVSDRTLVRDLAWLGRYARRRGEFLIRRRVKHLELSKVENVDPQAVTEFILRDTPEL